MELTQTDRFALRQRAEGILTVTPETHLGKSARQFIRQPASLVGIFIVACYLVLALLGDHIAPYPYTEQHLADILQPPSTRYIFGTDQFGRDIFSRVIVGSRSILILACSATLLALLLGVVMGVTAGYAGGLWDELIMRLVDVLLSFPALLLALLVVGIMGSDLIYLVLTIGVVFAPAIARVVRSVVLDIKTKTYVEAALAVGATTTRIALRHILPNAMGTIGVEASIYFGYVILIGAGLGFLGLGVQPPSPDWGLQVNEGRVYILTAPWVVAFPALAISSLVVGMNLLADSLTGENAA